jgi:hypothetical protein
MISNRILRAIKHPKIMKSLRQDIFLNITVPPFWADFRQKTGALRSPTPCPSCPDRLVGFSVELLPQSAVHERLATEYLLIISVAVIVFVALSAKELLKVLPVKVKDSLTRQVF